MIRLELIAPESVVGPQDVEDRAKESLEIWRVRYGRGHHAQDHIDLMLFGIIPISYVGQRAVLWAYSYAQKVPGKILVEARGAFFRWEEENRWECIAIAHSERNARFLRFMGLQYVTEVDGAKFYRSMTHGC
jgi:hypothetical protein